MSTFARFAFLGGSMCLLVLAGCGGGGDDDDDEPSAPVGPGWTVPFPPPGAPSSGATVDGIFRDAVVEGLDYSDGGALSGITGAAGNFQYAQGNTVTFRIGGLTLGSLAGQPVMTPMHFASTANLTQSINNRLRLLQMLDVDGNPDNGILISNATRAVAAGWTTPDFTVSDSAFDTAIASIRQAAISADGGTHAIPTSAAAAAHFVRTQWCTYNGLYRGNFTGSGDSGVFALVVYGQGGLMFGGGYSNVDRAGFELQKQTATGLSIFPAFTTGQVSTGATFSGSFGLPDRMTGTWSSPPDSGTFIGGRSFGSPNAKYRISGYVFPLGTALLIALEVDSANAVTGHIIDRDYLRTAEPVALTGTLSGTTLTATAANNLYTINGTFNTANAASLQLTGALRDNVKNRDVTLTGSPLAGCKLN